MKSPAAPRKRAAAHWPAILLLLLGLCFFMLGISRGELNAVFQKAARLCLECIGIG